MAFYSGWKQKLKKLLKRIKAKQPNLLTKLTINQVQHIQTQHSYWLDPQMHRGKKANFKMCKLPIAARFGGNYDEVSFQGSYLRGIFFKGASLLSSNFREANLQDTDFSDAVGLRTESIAGADVTNSKLPEDIKNFETLDVLREAAKNARKLFLIMLLACVYSAITIATTTDVRLITNSTSSPLPIIGAEIPIVSFFLVMPLFLVGIYIYFQISMQRIWEGLAQLPAIFPDGIPLDQKVYPWLLLGLVRKHFALLKKNRPPLHRIQSVISSFWHGGRYQLFLYFSG